MAKKTPEPESGENPEPGETPDGSTEATERLLFCGPGQYFTLPATQEREAITFRRGEPQAVSAADADAARRHPGVQWRSA